MRLRWWRRRPDPFYPPPRLQWHGPETEYQQRTREFMAALYAPLLEYQLQSIRHFESFAPKEVVPTD
jgi:hypothetical protein